MKSELVLSKKKVLQKCQADNFKNLNEILNEMKTTRMYTLH